MKVGQLAQGHRTGEKLATPRHRVLSRATADTCERAAERRVRQAGRKAIREALDAR
jgi:hypothetical protein